MEKSQADLETERLILSEKLATLSYNFATIYKAISQPFRRRQKSERVNIGSYVYLRLSIYLVGSTFRGHSWRFGRFGNLRFVLRSKKDHRANTSFDLANVILRDLNFT